MKPVVPYRWLVVGLLFVLSIINFLDRQTLSVLAPTLRRELGFSVVEYSYIVTTFLAAYTIGYAFCGAIIDRLGVRWSVFWAVAIWSTATMAHTFSTSWQTLAGCRFLLGLAEAFSLPCGIKALSEWIPQRERGLCTAIFSNGGIVGTMLAPPVVSLLALRYGWQSAFVITGALSFAYLVLWLRVYYSPQQHPRLSTAERTLITRELSSSAPAKSLSVLVALQHPLCIGFMVARFLTDSLSFFFTFWLPEYLQSARGFSLAMIGALGWIPFLASDIGGPGGGAMSDWLVRRGWTPLAARRRMMLVAACVMPAAVAAVHVRSAGVALALIALLLAAQSCWMANILTMMSEVFPRAQVATYVSVSAIGGSVGGIVSTLLAGKVIAEVGYVPVFTGLGFIHLTAFAVVRYCLTRTGGGQAGLSSG